MIWVRGQIVAEEAVQISVRDRVFEHGLGLFETFRTWNGHPTLMARHVARLERSASDLGLPLEPGQLPDARDLADLIAASRGAVPGCQDVRIRFTLSGGLATSPPSASVLWMSARALPPPLDRPGAVVNGSIEVAADDPLAHHKTLNYWRKRVAHEEALAAGADEVLCVGSGRIILEATRSNVFLVEGQRLCTPKADAPLLPGVMRGLVLEHAPRLGVEVEEGLIPLERITQATEAFLTNSVRGMLPVARLLDAELPAPGPVTRLVWTSLLRWLESGGTIR
jgi:branched-subunit amino acid aminotransferase/4-amino-4-deoxychorismate lyase